MLVASCTSCYLHMQIETQANRNTFFIVSVSPDHCWPSEQGLRLKLCREQHSSTVTYSIYIPISMFTARTVTCWSSVGIISWLFGIITVSCLQSLSRLTCTQDLKYMRFVMRHRKGLTVENHIHVGSCHFQIHNIMVLPAQQLTAWRLERPFINVTLLTFATSDLCPFLIAYFRAEVTNSECEWKVASKYHMGSSLALSKIAQLRSELRFCCNAF